MTDLGSLGPVRLPCVFGATPATRERWLREATARWLYDSFVAVVQQQERAIADALCGRNQPMEYSGFAVGYAAPRRRRKK